MARTPLLTLRVADETKARWAVAAKERGYESLAEFVRGCVEAELVSGARPAKVGGHEPVAVGPPPSVPPARRSDSRASAVPKARRQMCEHRRGPDEYCSRCDG